MIFASGMKLHAWRLLVSLVCGRVVCTASVIPEVAWPNVQLSRPAQSLSLDAEGRHIGSLTAEPAACLVGLVVTQAADALVVDTRPACAAGGEPIGLHFVGPSVADWRGRSVLFTLDYQAPGPVVEFTVETRYANGHFTRTAKEFRAEPGRRTQKRVMLEMPDNLVAVFYHVTLSSAGIYRFHRIVAEPCAKPEPYRKVEPQLLFHAPFDGIAAAVFARGAATPIRAEGLEYVKGLMGGGLRFTPAARPTLTYSFTNNVDSVRGTVTFWFKPEGPADDAVSRMFFRFIPMSGFSREGSGALWIWKTANAGFRADTWPWQGPGVRWEPFDYRSNEWTHVAIAWDERGERAYVNGERVLSRSVDYSAYEAMGRSPERLYTRAPMRAFSVGSAEDGTQPIDGVMDELRIYSAPLGERQIQVFAGEGRPFRLLARRTHFVEGAAATVPVAFINQSDCPQAAAWVLVGTGVSGTTAQSLAPGATNRVEITVPALKPGTYTLQVSGARGLPCEESLYVIPRKNPEVSDTSELRLEPLEALALDRLPPSERFVAKYPVHFGELGGRRYLETATNAFSRYAVRFRLPKEGSLFCFDFEYPDDQPRAAEIIVQPCVNASGTYELETGYLSGDDVRPTGRFITWRCLYWARQTRDIAVMLTTRQAGQSAALAGIRLFRVRGGLPPAPVIRTPGIRMREIGIYYEDPDYMEDFASPGSNEAAFSRTVNRLTAYMRYSGQTLLALPYAWYDGILNEGDAQRRYGKNPEDSFLARCDADGLGYELTLNLLRPALPDDLRVTARQLENGEANASVFNVLSNGLFSTFRHSDYPALNPLHPFIRQQLQYAMNRALEAGRGHPAFRGVNLHVARYSCYGFGCLAGGYNDYVIDAFTRDTGIHVPVNRRDPLRGKAVAAWLLANAREAWIDWRCKQLADLYRPFAERMQREAPQARLVFTLFTNPRLFTGDVNAPDYLDRLNREAGFDVARYADLTNVVFAQALYPADYRHFGDRQQSWFESFRPYLRDRYDRASSYATLARVRQPRIELFDRYWESDIGVRPNPLTASWFHEQKWRVSTLTHAGSACLRQYVKPLKYADVRSYTKGGFLIGTYGMEPWLTPFTRAFRALPDVPFASVTNADGDVVVRTACVAGFQWYYAVNTGETPAACSVRLTGKTDQTIDLLTGRKPSEQSGDTLTLLLPPYAFRSFRTAN